MSIFENLSGCGRMQYQQRKPEQTSQQIKFKQQSQLTLEKLNIPESLCSKRAEADGAWKKVCKVERSTSILEATVIASAHSSPVLPSTLRPDMKNGPEKLSPEPSSELFPPPGNVGTTV